MNISQTIILHYCMTICVTGIWLKNTSGLTPDILSSSQYKEEKKKPPKNKNPTTQHFILPIKKTPKQSAYYKTVSTCMQPKTSITHSRVRFGSKYGTRGHWRLLALEECARDVWNKVKLLLSLDNPVLDIVSHGLCSPKQCLQKQSSVSCKEYC